MILSSWFLFLYISYLIERIQVRVQSDPVGRLVITGMPEHVDNPWGITPFKKASLNKYILAIYLLSTNALICYYFVFSSGYNDVTVVSSSRISHVSTEKY
jgi:hypothetical protein